MGAPGKDRETVSLGGGLRAALAARATREGLSKSTLIRKAVMAYLGVDADGRPTGGTV